MTNTQDDELRHEIWSRSLKYLDMLNNTISTGELYFAYRDSKASELATEVMQLIHDRDVDRDRQARIDGRADLENAIRWNAENSYGSEEAEKAIEILEDGLSYIATLTNQKEGES